MSIEAFVKQKNTVSNYERMKQRSAALLTEHDLPGAAAILHGSTDGAYVYLKLLDMTCRVRIADGFAQWKEPDTQDYREADHDTAMTLYDLLGMASQEAHPGGELAPIERFSRVQNARSYAGAGLFEAEAALFERRFADLPAACENIGGIPWGRGDAGYRFSLTAGLDVAISFYRADEEFPPSLTVFFDTNTTQYMHYETMWYAAFVCLRRIADKL